MGKRGLSARMPACRRGHQGEAGAARATGRRRVRQGPVDARSVGRARLRGGHEPRLEEPRHRRDRDELGVVAQPLDLHDPPRALRRPRRRSEDTRVEAEPGRPGRQRATEQDGSDRRPAQGPYARPAARVRGCSVNTARERGPAASPTRVMWMKHP